MCRKFTTLVVKPEALYASETLIIGGGSLRKDVEKQE